MKTFLLRYQRTIKFFGTPLVYIMSCAMLTALGAFSIQLAKNYDFHPAFGLSLMAVTLAIGLFLLACVVAGWFISTSRRKNSPANDALAGTLRVGRV